MIVSKFKHLKILNSNHQFINNSQCFYLSKIKSLREIHIKGFYGVTIYDGIGCLKLVKNLKKFETF